MPAWLRAPLLGGFVRPPFLLLFGFVISGSVSLHILTPTLPAVALDLAVSAGPVQLTITLFVVGLAAGQLLYGPLSDRFGRRPVLLAGLLIYTLGSVAAAMAPGLPTLLGARVLQALGACSGMVLGRAMVRDNAPPEQAGRQLAMLNLCITIAPALAPMLGNQLSVYTSWRMIFVLLAAMGGVVLLASLLVLPETNMGGHRSGGFSSILPGFVRLLREQSFRVYALAGACSTTSFYAYLTASPFIFTQMLHRPAEEAGVYYLAIMAGVPFGSFAASRLARRMPLGRLLRLTGKMTPGRLLTGAFVISTLGGLMMLVCVLLGQLSLVTVLLAILIFTIGGGIVSPLALSLAIGTVPGMVGAASGLYGFVQMGFGALCTLAVTVFPQRPELTAAVVLVVAALSSQAYYALWRWRGDGPAAQAGAG